ncbi:hypothetical protein HAX54_041430, partial [Datura stramonium]|nr:hypothetical protein [Datura stramonium]
GTRREGIFSDKAYYQQLLFREEQPGSPHDDNLPEEEEDYTCLMVFYVHMIRRRYKPLPLALSRGNYCIVDGLELLQSSTG